MHFSNVLLSFLSDEIDVEKVRCPWTDSLSSSGFGALFKVRAHEDDGEQNLRKIKRKCVSEPHDNMEFSFSL